MKKLLTIIGLALLLGTQLLATATAFADTQPAPATAGENGQQSSPATTSKLPADKLLPQFKPTEGQQTGIKDELTNYSNLTNASWTQIVTSAIKTLLFVAGTLVLIGLLVVGAMFLTGASNEESITKARKILIYLVIGIILISVSYALVSGISQFKLGE